MEIIKRTSPRPASRTSRISNMPNEREKYTTGLSWVHWDFVFSLPVFVALSSLWAGGYERTCMPKLLSTTALPDGADIAKFLGKTMSLIEWPHCSLHAARRRAELTQRFPSDDHWLTERTADANSYIPLRRFGSQLSYVLKDKALRFSGGLPSKAPVAAYSR